MMTQDNRGAYNRKFEVDAEKEVKREPLLQPSAAWSPGHISLRDGVIIGDFYDKNNEYEEMVVYPDKDALQEFATLWQAGKSDADILDFAENFGVLGIFVKDKEAAVFIHQEPCDGWRKYSGQAQAIMNIAARLLKSEFGAAEDWAVLKEHLKHHGIMRPDDKLTWERLLLGHVLNCWLEIGDVRPRFEWDAESTRWQMALRGSKQAGCFGVLALHLALVAAGVDGFAICAGCHTSYIPTRQPKAGCDSYCEVCRSSGVALRVAKRASRERQRKEEK